MRGKGGFTASSRLMSRSSVSSSRRRRSSTRPTMKQISSSARRLTSSSVAYAISGSHHPELGEMAARLRLFGAERRAETVGLAERHRRGFVVELPGLGQVDLLVAEVVDLEQRGRALAGRRREDRRVDQREAVRVEVVADRANDLVAHPQDRVRAARAQVQMPVVEQELDAVLLRRDRVRLRLRDAMDDLGVVDVELVAARRARLRAHPAAYDQRGFLRQVAQLLETFFTGIVFTATHCMIPVPSRSPAER